MKSLRITTFLLACIPSVALCQLGFKPPVTAVKGYTPEEILVGDFNGDNKQDFVMLSSPEARTTVYYSQGSDKDPIKKEFTITSGEYFTAKITVADVNNDGLDDLLVIDPFTYTSGALTVCLSKGEDFDVRKATDMTLKGSSIQVVDFDGDDSKDILIASLTELQFFKGDGTGQFTETPLDNPPSIPTNTYNFFVLDINNDEKLDFVFDGTAFVVTAIRTQNTYSSVETGLPATPFDAMVEDFNGDGIRDYVCRLYTNGKLQIQYYIHDGHGAFESPLTIYDGEDLSGGKPRHADYDQDGLEDIVLSTSAAEFSPLALHNTGEGNFDVVRYEETSARGYYPALAFGDLDGTGASEIIAATGSTLIQFYQYEANDMVDQFGKVHEFIFGIHSHSGVVYDLDGDGIKDLVGAGTLSGTVAVWYGKGDVQYEDPIYFRSLPDMRAVSVADFNGDGFGDIVFNSHAPSSVDGELSVILSSAVRSYAAPKKLNDGGMDNDLVTVDVDNNSTVDLVTGTMVYKNDGEGNFTPSTSIYTSFAPLGISSGHFNNDGFVDLAFFAQKKIYIGLNDGAGAFSSFTEVSTEDLDEKQLIDLDGNTYSDFIGITEDEEIIILKGIGDGQFTPTIVDPTSGFSELTHPTVGDLNEDGLMDIILMYADENKADGATLLGKAGGGFGDLEFRDLLIPGSLSLTDINDDEKLDIVSFSANGEVVYIHINDNVKEPTIAPSEITVTPSDVSATVTFQKGNGNGRIVLIREDLHVDASPVDQTIYTANSEFGEGTKIGDENYVVVAGNSTSVTITSLEPGTKYVVTAYEYNMNSKNDVVDYLLSAASISFTTLKAQTITFGNITPKALDEGTYTITATASSGLDVILSVMSGAGTLTENIFTPTAAGKVTIKAEQEGNSEYGASTQEVTFCVNPLKPTISLSADLIPLLTSSSDSDNNWYVGGIAINGANTKAYRPTEDGIYKVGVTVDGCTSFSEPTAHIIAAVEDNWINSFSVSPNPVTSFVRITVPPGFDLNSEPVFFSSTGARLQLQTMNRNDGFEVNTSDLHPGMYIVRLAGASLKMIKQ